MKLPVKYEGLYPSQKKEVREQYIKEQKGKCFWCKHDLNKEAPEHITTKPINWKLFPRNFLKYPVHLQHDHNTGLTEGAVHNYCNAVMWQYHKR